MVVSQVINSLTKDKAPETGYGRPLLDVEQRDPINKILTDNYNYLLDHGLTIEKRYVNKNMDQTLLVWEFINGEGTLPKKNASPGEGTLPKKNASPYANVVPTNTTEEITNTSANFLRGGRRLRKSRKLRKSSRRNRH